MTGSTDDAMVVELSPGSYTVESGGYDAGLIPPIDQTVAAGSSPNFNVLAVADSSLSYQWKFNDLPIANATDSSLVLSDVQPTDEGSYSVQLSTTAETVTTAPAILNVLGGGPVRATQSSNVTELQPEASATITVQIEWDEPPNLIHQTTLPEGWIMRSHTATGTSSAPADDATGILIWEFGTPAGDSPMSFTFDLEAPSGFMTPIALEGGIIPRADHGQRYRKRGPSASESLRVFTL